MEACVRGIYRFNHCYFCLYSFASMMTHPIMKLLYSLLIVYTAFGFTTFRNYAQTVLLLLCNLYGWRRINGHSFLLQTNEMVNGLVQSQSISYGDPISWLFVIFGFPVIYYFSKSVLKA